MARFRQYSINRRQLLVAGITLAATLALPMRLFAQSDKLKIGVIGSGKMGSAIGGALLKAGHQVMFSSRTLADDQALAESLGPNAFAGTPREAVEFGDVVVVSVPFLALPSIKEQVGDLLQGKFVLETCNAYERRDGDMAVKAHEKGVAFAVAEYLPGARVIRSFNAIGFPTVASAPDNPGQLGMPFAAMDAEAEELGSRLITDIGFEPVLIGDWSMANYLHPDTPVAREHTAAELREIIKTLD